jgi:hypothetical protein
MYLGIAIGLVVGFVAAYGFDTWLQWKDDHQWK